MKVAAAAVLLSLLACSDPAEPPDPAPDAGALACTSSTLPESGPDWTACRAMDPDSVPVFCEGGAMPTACDFEAPIAGGGTAVCRPPGGCE